MITLSFAPGPSGFDGSEYSGSSLAFIEVHELCHWALKSEEQPETPFEEEGWHAVLWDAMDYIQDEQPDGPWFSEERDIRTKLTSRKRRQNATEIGRYS